MKKRAEIPKVTVVINTCDRGAYLGDTLEGLKQQTYSNFEVVLVNGPSIDNTEEVALSYNVRYFRAPFNISVSRNVGVKNAAGEILAFIDDDAVPEPNWLEDLVKAYDDPSVGAAGGFVYNDNGSDFQYKYGAIDKWGYPVTRTDKPYTYNDPKGPFYNINIGTNASYRRSALIEVGGFDEEIEYYHDESDVCVRIIRAGYKVAQLDNAFVHHKFAPSFRRNNSKRVTNWNAIVKNTIYFGIKYTQGNEPMWKRLAKPAWKEKRKFAGVTRSLLMGDFGPIQFVKSFTGVITSMVKGYKRGFSKHRKLLSGYKYQPEEFKKFITEENKHSKNIILVSQGFPPHQTDGICRYNFTLAKALANAGHRVFVITKNPKKGINIEYRDKFWVYYHDPSSLEKDITGFGRVDNLLALTKSVYKVAEGIRQKSAVDLVVAPLWDVEGLALIRRKIAPTILTLMSPLKKVVETQWYYLDDPSLEVVYELEKYCVENADAVMPISEAIKKTIADSYNVEWKNTQAKDRIKTIPLGVEKSLIKADIAPKKSSDKSVDVLFVGRFERRKGIDLLLESMTSILPKNPNVRLHLVGNPDIQDENGKYIYKDFVSKHKKAGWLSQITQYGYISDEDLANMYGTCDIFVAPSRYESFGLIFIEAMAAGKPVVGTNVGGIPEVITDGKNGYLFENESIDALTEKLTLLIKDRKLRESMGKSSKTIIDEKFSADKMLKKFLELANSLQ